MRSIPFEKYHGTGNDFILILDLENEIRPLLSQELIAQWCERRYGVGADGLMLVQSADDADFKMIYYNSDGRESTMCGNGGRCIAHFALTHGVCGSPMKFIAIDGLHDAAVDDISVQLGMIDVQSPEQYQDGWVIDTGSPHYVEYRETFPEDFITQAKSIRYNDRFAQKGINVNYVVLADGQIHIRTYERGVENETHSCGTGVTAAALVHLHTHPMHTESVKLKAHGGLLSVIADRKASGGFKDVKLSGPTIRVFAGRLNLV